MMNLMRWLIVFLMIFGQGCACVIDRPAYEVRYESVNDIHDVVLLLDNKPVGPALRVKGTSSLIGAHGAIVNISNPVTNNAELHWKTEQGQEVIKKFNLLDMLPDEWRASRDCIVFRVRSDNSVHVTFKILRGSSWEDWYELPPKSEMEQEN